MHLQAPPLPGLVCPDQGILGMRRPGVLGEKDPIAGLDQNPVYKELGPVGHIEGRAPGQGLSHNKEQGRGKAEYSHDSVSTTWHRARQDRKEATRCRLVMISIPLT